MRHRFFKLSITLVSVLVSAGCDLFSETAVWTAKLPALPAHWRDTFPDAAAELLIVDAGGSSSSAVVPLGAGSWPVPIRKTGNTLVLLYPKAGEERLRPYGAVFPACGDEGTRILTLSIMGGFTAERLAHLARQGFPIESFNAARLISLLEEKGGDPWDNDPIYLETRLAGGDFSVYAVKKLPARAVTLVLPPGEWFSESPAAPPWMTDAGGTLIIPALAYGTHILFRRGTAECAFLQVSEREVRVLCP